MSNQQVESWNDDNFVSYNPLQQIENKDILRSAFSIIGKSKKVKRQFRLAERERHSLLEQKKQEKVCSGEEKTAV